jgi:hypothetical protein
VEIQKRNPNTPLGTPSQSHEMPISLSKQPITLRIQAYRAIPAVPPNSPFASDAPIPIKASLSRELRSLIDTRHFEHMPKDLPLRRNVAKKSVVFVESARSQSTAFSTSNKEDISPDRILPSEMDLESRILGVSEATSVDKRTICGVQGK